MALTYIEPMGQAGMPPIVPSTVAKSQGFNFLPPGTKRLHDARTWGLYYYPAANVSYLVYDLGTHWRVKPVLGKMRIGYAKGVMATKPCCQEN